MAALQIAKFESKNNEPEETKQELHAIPRVDVPCHIKISDTSPVQLIDKGNYALIPSELDPTHKDVISCLCISDTHGQHGGIEEKFGSLPCADILIHSGDFSNIGHWGDIKSYDSWINGLLHQHKKFKHCVLIGGNHDITLHTDYYIKCGYNRFHAGNPQKQDMLRYAAKCRQRAMKHSVYLQDDCVELLGIRFYGSPWVPSLNNWAFMLERGEALREKWKSIVEDVDVLITHGPPLYHGDVSSQSDEQLQSNCVGDVELLKRAITDVRPRFHVFGHNHEGYGATTHKGLDTVFVNAATLNRDYKVSNKPIIFYIQKKRRLKPEHKK